MRKNDCGGIPPCNFLVSSEVCVAYISVKKIYGGINPPYLCGREGGFQSHCMTRQSVQVMESSLAWPGIHMQLKLEWLDVCCFCISNSMVLSAIWE